MFMGHMGVALAARGLRDDLGLPLLCVTAVAPDLVDFARMSRFPGGAGPWSHSIAAAIGYALLFFLVARCTAHRTGAALLLCAVALSHVPLDLVTSHMVLWHGGPAVGLHLYRHRAADFLLESAVVAAGWMLYLRSLPPQRRFAWASVAMLLVLLAMQGLMATVNVS